VARIFKRKSPLRSGSKQPESEPKAAAPGSEETHSAQTTAEVYKPATPAASPTVAEPEAPNMLDALAASLIADGGFHFAPSQAAIDTQPNGRKVESITLGDNLGGWSLLKLAGGDQSAASAGFTDGFSIRVPDAFEREAGEHTVRVRVLARSAEIAPTRLAISTNEAGNSGWQWGDVGVNWGICELVWKVPKMVNGGGDFIGLMPGAPGVEVHSVTATVV